MKSFLRTQDCGALRKSHLGQEVTLSGWVATRRDHGGLIFLDLRDRYGMTQVVCDPSGVTNPTAFEQASRIRSEFVVSIQGKVRARPQGMANKDLPTGEIEVACHDLQILSEAKTPPFPIEDGVDISETLRLKYRYLDLRRPSLQKNLEIRHRLLTIVREFLNEHQFLEVETPILYKSTPEGARDFIVPSRLNPKMFYALPQSPQTLKQLLMVAGIDRYYQIARCFRDEDLRADRQPEFTQIDIETSFLGEEQIFGLMEEMIARVWKNVLGREVKRPFPRMTYEQAMKDYGSDKPDIRFGLKLQDLSEIFEKSSFRVFSSALEKDSRGRRGAVRALYLAGQAEKFSRKDLDDLTEESGRYGAKGLLWIKVQAGTGGALELQSPAAKFFSETEKTALTAKLGLKVGDLILMIADAKDATVCTALGAVRLSVGRKLNMLPDLLAGEPAFLWVHRFPLLEYDEKEHRFFALHHPFTRPVDSSVEDFVAGRNLDRLEAAAYDMVLNGAEVGGGSLRIYRSDVQAAMFKALGLSEKDAQDQFGFFLEALQYGTPPHGGIAFGVERLAAMLCGAPQIRDVMAFPKTQRGQCLMSGSPSEVKPEQLVELAISLRS